MQFIEPGRVELRPLHSLPMMNASTTKVRRKLFADSPPLNHQQIKNDATNLLNREYQRFKANYNFDFDANEPLTGPYAWRAVDSDKAPAFYSRPYPAKTADSLRKHLMACVKSQSDIIRDNFYHNGQILSLANLVAPCLAKEQMTTTTTATHPVLPETPCKGSSTTHTYRSSSCGTKRKLSQEDDSAVSDLNEVPNSPLRSHSPSETAVSSSTTELSSQSEEEDSVGHILQNNNTTTDKPSSSSQTTRQTSSRQTNITEYMKSQKNPTEPVAKHPRRS